MLKHYSQLLLRAPLLSLQAVDNIGTQEPDIFQEGIYLSSMDFWQELQKKDELSEKEKEKLYLTYTKYWIRSCTRCTPYGTFAGFAMIDIVDSQTQLVVDEKEKHDRKLRIDLSYIVNLVNTITKIPCVYEQIKFYTNNSIYELSSGYRYAENLNKKGSTKYELTSLKKTDYLRSILEHAQSGETIKGLTEILIAFDGITRDEAREFLAELVSSQILVSELEPTITGKEPFLQLIEKISAIEGVESLQDELHHIKNLLNSRVKGVAQYQEINTRLQSLVDISGNVKNSVQVDLLLGFRSKTISEELINSLTGQLQDLFLLSRQSESSELESFKKKFIEKYEDVEMPLTLVLDAESGIGFGEINEEASANNSLINDLVFQNPNIVTQTEFDHIQQLAFNKYHDFLKNHKEVINIDESDLQSLKKKSDHFKFSKSIYVLGSLMKENGQLDKDNFLFDVSAFGGTSAANLYGKFTHASTQLTSLTKEILKKEENEIPDAIYAEIVHLPEAHVGNILLRPVLRPYEIPYVGGAGTDDSHQILLNDLYVAIQQGEVVLISKRLCKRVIPKLTTAHNYQYKTLPVYKFLCSLQSQAIAKVNVWDWGNLEILKFLPRVVYKKLIIKKATWKFTEEDLSNLPAKPMELRRYFADFKIKWALPDLITYLDEDNKLLIDFSQDHGILLFIHYLKKLKRIIVEEYLFTEDNCIVRDAAGLGYANEIVLPLYEDMLSQVSSPLKVRQINSVIKRKFLPISEWCYFKIYAGLKVSEQLLTNEILNFVEDGLKDDHFKKFFFVRYKDDFAHVRIRFYNTDINKQATLSNNFLSILQPFLDQGHIDKINIDTYIRETGRYGEDLVEEAENLFHNDSLTVLRLISLIEGSENEIYRMLFALRGIDMLLDDFSLTNHEKEDLARHNQSLFFKEFGGGDALQSQLNNKYRRYKDLIFSHLDPSNDEENGIAEVVKLFSIRSEENIPVIARINSKVSLESSRQRFFELLTSYIHMFINRMFIGKQRMNELVIYHFLERYYKSRAAILKTKKKMLINSNI